MRLRNRELQMEYFLLFHVKHYVLSICMIAIRQQTDHAKLTEGAREHRVGQFEYYFGHKGLEIVLSRIDQKCSSDNQILAHTWSISEQH